MKKAFLSHSSKDKNFVEIVARKLGRDYCVYDAMTFETGMKTLDEIYRGLDDSDIFVIFLSDAALDSEWVTEERRRAKELEDKGAIKKIFPFLIDSKITYKDSRIPKWLSREYNIRQVASPKIAANKIKACMLEVEWRQNPRLAAKYNQFIGRNNEVQVFEERRADLDHELKTIVASSGFDGIGRKAYMRHVLIKDNLMDDTYYPSIITLEKHQSIEDFILKIADLGYKEVTAVDISRMTMDEKISFAAGIINSIQLQHDIVFINDNGVIVNPDQKLVSWFRSLLDKLDYGIIFGIASTYNLPVRNAGNDVFSIRIHELTIKERKLLFRDKLRMTDLNLKSEQVETISDNLSGYPEQISFAVQMLQDEGVYKTLDNLHEIKAFSDEKADAVLSRYVDTEDKLKFLAFISAFEFLNMQTLDTVYSKYSQYKDYMNSFLAVSICEYIGSNGEYVKINDVLKDVVFRRRISMGKDLHDLYKIVLSYTVDKDFIENNDLATYYNVVQSNLEKAEIDGRSENIDEKYVVPSQYLRCIVDQYNQKRYTVAESLCKRLIEGNQMVNFDKEIIRQIKYFYCETLARLHKKKCLKVAEGKEFSPADRSFLKGFYYRITGKSKLAIENLMDAINQRPNFPTAKRELANAYIACDQYKKAREICEENYKEDSRNPFFIQPYFETVIHLMTEDDDKELLTELLDNMASIDTQQARQMYACMLAEYKNYIEKDFDGANEVIDQALTEVDNKIYLYLTKFDVAYSAKNESDMERVLAHLRNKITTKDYFYIALLNREIKYYRYKGNEEKINELVGVYDRLRGYKEGE